jgi:cell wall-associated protease
MKIKFLSAALFFSLAVFAQDPQKAPENWFNLDQSSDKVNGVGTERVYKELLNGKKSTTVIVGVIDSGVDIDHEDLKDVIWTNTKEIPDNGIDDDKNGYIDDIHGWNFIGGKGGKNISYERLELVRIYKKLDDKYKGQTESEAQDKKEYKLYVDVKEKFNKESEKYSGQLMQVNFLFNLMDDLNTDVKKSLGVDKVNKAALGQYKTDDARKKQMVAAFKSILTDDEATLDDVIEETKEGKEYLEARVKYNLNPDFDPRPEIVGDNINDPYQKDYGNNDVKGSDATHGTHVSGIIAAVRTNEIGIKGIADNVKIMPIRAVPNGDERDKDIANAIYYAVDNGCQIINMSFGKGFVVDKEALDKAIKYAEDKGVLLVHAAGNESTNIDLFPNFPTKKIASSRKGCKTWIEVGALSWKKGEDLAASFSNFGKKSVDIFAPGVDIYSTVPGSKYKKESGTSMACPATAGCAAVLKSYFPQLTAKEIKKILEKSSNTSDKKSKINQPAQQGAGQLMADFSDLSKTGGYINLYEAVKMAMKMTGMKG